jgi:hypothetical protein
LTSLFGLESQLTVSVHVCGTERMNNQRKPWTPPFTSTEWLALAVSALGTLVLGACGFMFASATASAFGVDFDLLTYAPVVIGVILIVMFMRRRRR